MYGDELLTFKPKSSCGLFLLVFVRRYFLNRMDDKINHYRIDRSANLTGKRDTVKVIVV